MPVNVADAPPRKTPRASSAKTSAHAQKTTANEQALNGITQIVGFGLIMGGQYHDAGALGTHGPKICHELAALADQNEKVASMIGYLTEAGPYAGVITACMPLVLQILANHGRIPAEKVAAAGVVPPAVLEAQVRAEMARAEAQAMQDMQEAEDYQREVNERLAAQRAANGQAEPEDLRAYDSASD